MYIFSPRLRFVTLFVLAYLLAGAAGALALGNKEFILYEIEMVVILAILVFMDRRVQFSQLVLWGLSIWGGLHLAGGLVPIPEMITEPGGHAQVLYNMRLAPFMPKYDQMLHAFGFGMCAVTAHEALQAHFKKSLPINVPIAAVLFFIALGLGCVNEIIELAVMLNIPEANVGGYINTGWDLVSNATGVALAIVYLKVFRQ